MPERDDGATRPANAEPGRGRDWLLLGLLVLLVLPLRCWLLYNTEVTARDSIGYIRYALAFEHKPWPQVWQEQDQHPGYPLAVWAMAIPVRAWAGHTNAATMQLSTQLVSFIAALLLLYPMYHLGRILLDRRAGFWGCLLFQYWPVSARHLSDGISETLFLLLLVSALLQAVQAVQGQAAWRFALCGLFCGLAYLTRPEGLLVLPAVAVVLLARQWRPAWRCSWRRCLACGASLVLVAGAVGSVYVVTTGRITNKISALKVIQPATELIHRLWHAEVNDANAFQLAGAPGAPLFAATYTPTDVLRERLAYSAKCLLDELNQGFHYLGSPFAVLGFWWFFATLRGRPGFWVLLTYGLTHALVLFLLAMVVFYVYDRHTMILVLLGTFLVAAGLYQFPQRLRWQAAGDWALVLLLGLVGFCLPKSVRRLHAERAGNHAAGLWLAGQKDAGALDTRRGDIVLDDHYWSHFYAGGLFEEYQPVAVPAGQQPWAYLVQTRTKGQPLEAGEVVYHWPADGAVEYARVVILKRPRDRDKNPW